MGTPGCPIARPTRSGRSTPQPGTCTSCDTRPSVPALPMGTARSSSSVSVGTCRCAASRDTSPTTARPLSAKRAPGNATTLSRDSGRTAPQRLPFTPLTPPDVLTDISVPLVVGGHVAQKTRADGTVEVTFKRRIGTKGGRAATSRRRLVGSSGEVVITLPSVVRVLAALPQDRPLAWDLVEQAIGP